MQPTISLVVPIFNEKGNIPELYRRVKEVMDSTGDSWELVLVDDGSTDGSTEMIRELANKMSACVRSSLRAILAIRLPSQPGWITAAVRPW